MDRAANAPLMLSVSGARGLVGRSMTPAVAADFAATFASVVKIAAGGAAPVVCLGRDSRPSGEMLALAAAAGLTAVGAKVIDLGLAATPTVGVMVAERGAAGGVVITASHNPLPWNGLKCLIAGGVAPPKREADEIIRRFRVGEIDWTCDVERIGCVERETRADEIHVERVLATIDVARVRAAHFAVALDSVNGAGSRVGRLLLDALGCRVEHVNAEPTGRFGRAPEPLEENIGELAARTRETGCVCGFAQDPDGDRLAIVDEGGRALGEECTLVLAAREVLERCGAKGRGTALAANLSTSRMIDDLAARYGAVVHRSAVGEANVAEVMKREGAIVGGEGNGGVMYPAVTWVRDSIGAMGLVLALMVREGRPLSAIARDLPHYAMVKRKADLVSIGGQGAVAGALGCVVEAYTKASARLSTVDGVRVDLDEGWVHLRPSNTEPIVRLIAEARTAALADVLARQVAAAAGLTALS